MDINLRARIALQSIVILQIYRPIYIKNVQLTILQAHYTYCEKDKI